MTTTTTEKLLQIVWSNGRGVKDHDAHICPAMCFSIALLYAFVCCLNAKFTIYSSRWRWNAACCGFCTYPCKLCCIERQQRVARVVCATCTNYVITQNCALLSECRGAHQESANHPTNVYNINIGAVCKWWCSARVKINFNYWHGRTLLWYQPR